MKGKGKGIDNVREKRIAFCKSSLSSSIERRMLCSYGEEVALLKSKSMSNPRNFFGDAPIGMWSDGEMTDLQQSKIEDWQLYEEEIEELKRKVSKLRRKLANERWKVKAVVACIILTPLITLGVLCLLG
ncbi:hypothetical protein SESBI_07195 [Sesbania bispinosa]|nr:hypothetical protein SESBI_07195 [Sesbania bispinosa]